PIASTTISTSASPIDRHRIERIGGDIICDSALMAASSMGTLSRNYPREVDTPGRFGKGGLPVDGRDLRLRHDAGPAGDGAADRAPAAEPLVDLGGDLLLLLQRALGLDLGIGDVADREPARRLGAHVLRHETQHGVAHFGDVAEALKTEMIVR